MKAVGYVFTDSLIKALTKFGFAFAKKETPANSGYASYQLPLQNGTLEIREILDEDLYCTFAQKKNLLPFFESTQITEAPRECSNTVFSLKEIITQHDLKNKELIPYFKIRKESDFAAVLLEAKSLDSLIATKRVDQIFDFEGKKTALIHLNPACFDLLVQLA
jgi:hypothetical protein